jgi:hypothetical protein
MARTSTGRIIALGLAMPDDADQHVAARVLRMIREQDRELDAVCQQLTA